MSHSLRAQLQSTLGDAYTLERELGGQPRHVWPRIELANGCVAIAARHHAMVEYATVGQA